MVMSATKISQSYHGMLVDMSLPRPIPAKVALKMVQTSIKTIMYMRGQMGSTWEQLVQMLQLERLRFEEEQEQEREISPSTIPSTRASQRLRRRDNDGTLPTKVLQEFLEIGERMFVDLEESIYTQLSSRLALSGSVSSPLYISLALFIGTTITTPQEQYMMRIGPLEPLLTSCESSIPSIGVPLARLDARGTERYHHGQNGLDQLGQNNVSNPSGSFDKQQRQKLANEEKAWERRLVQQIVGISSVMDTSNAEDDESKESDVPPTNLSKRAKVHLLMKAPSGLVFQGMLPKQTIVLQEDYSIDDVQVAKSECPLSVLETAATIVNRTRRWPIYHIHVLGPAPERWRGDPGDDDHTNNIIMRELWYQVGSGIPVLSPLL
ncbi:hypothetical protein BGZ65_001457 [Modicella reniformis]|uniref:Uncharacterized protein n=1 Tax=Modicella reniformis TaxID=1440133 RepID=A0A9P6MBW4_9FUNG|nr:hypothetical protein BGZ65_001457 [Modicella reniformis]